MTSRVSIPCITGKETKKKMKVYNDIRKSLLAVLLIGWGCLLTNCSDKSEIEPDRPDVEDGQPLHLAGLTRVGDTDDDPMKGKDVQLFLVPQTGETLSGQVTYPGREGTGIDGGLSGSTIQVKPGVDYQVFGFMPAAIATGIVSVSGTTATMTISGLPAMSKEDVCIVTGVKAGALATGESVTSGNFNYHAPENTAEGYSLSLLADHLYAGLELKFLIDPTYNALRHIWLKKVELLQKSSQGSVVTATLTLNMNNANPLAVPVFTSTGEAPTLDLFGNEAGEELKVAEDDAIRCVCYVTHSEATTLWIKNTYDVYDIHGTKIRENQTAENSLAAVLTELKRGQKKTVKVTVNPTYLYVLSDWDINDPQFVVN